jgi:hypothetical protein
MLGQLVLNSTAMRDADTRSPSEISQSWSSSRRAWIVSSISFKEIGEDDVMLMIIGFDDALPESPERIDRTVSMYHASG